MKNKCKYCGKKKQECHVCKEQVRMIVMDYITKVELLIAKPEAIDQTGIITNHMRALWGLRDALNGYFNKTL